MSITSLSLTKPSLKTAVAESLFNEIISGTNNYYYFIGKTLDWIGGIDVEPPIQSIEYENDTRREIIFLKKITSADISYIIPRYDWVSGNVYDMYDDRIGWQMVVAATAPSSNYTTLSGSFSVEKISIGDTVTGSGIPVNTVVTAVTPTELTISNYTTAAVSSVTISCLSANGYDSLDKAKFYVVTSDRNVYKCIDNNNNSLSTVKPYATTHEVFQTVDGYIWKFMYTIPNSLVNKFMTTEYIPVTTSVKSAYYSRGSIYSVNILNYGNNYTLGDEIVITGDGYQRYNPYRILTISIDNPGYGYTSAPTVTIDPPFNSISWQSETLFTSNSYVSVGNYIYEVISGGLSGIDAPTYTGDDVFTNGAMTLRFTGYKLSATASLTDTYITNVSLTGIISFIKLTVVGSGYDVENPPAVTINGDGIGATAVAEISTEGHISNIRITNRGTGYSSAAVTIDPPVSGTAASAAVVVYYGYGYSITPNVQVAPPFTADIVWDNGGIVAYDDIVQYNTYFYKVTSAGVSQDLDSVTPPTHISGSAINGEATLLYIGETAQLSPTIELTKAQAAPIIESGHITGVIITDPGIGYTSATIKAVSSYGSGADITPNVAYGDLNTRQANVELLAIPGSIESIKMVNPGLGYTTADVTIVGNGTGCTATAVIEEGAITSIIITNAGYGYTIANVIITGNGTTQAYARAIISPAEGHGKNAIKELYAKDLSLSTTIAQDRNQGFIVDNDYRQLGVLKNPLEIDSTYRYNYITASTCYNITVVISTPDTNRTSQGHDQFQSDDVVINENGDIFQIVAAQSSSTYWTILVQDSANVAPQIGDILNYASNGVAEITNVTKPHVNKYSGDMLFIDNRASFKPTDEQTISIKTSISF